MAGNRRTAGFATGDIGATRRLFLWRDLLYPLLLHAHGELSTGKRTTHEATTIFRYDPADPVPTIGGNLSSVGGFARAGGFDQRCRKETLFAKDQLPLSERRDVLVFQRSLWKKIWN